MTMRYVTLRAFSAWQQLCFRSRLIFHRTAQKKTKSAVLLALLTCMIGMQVNEGFGQTEKGTEKDTDVKPTGGMPTVFEPTARPLVRKVFQLQHAEPEKIWQILRIFGTVDFDKGLRVVAVQVTPDVLPLVEETIHRLDVPPPVTKNIEITAYLLIASTEDKPGITIPADLEGVVKQLRTTLSFKSYRILDTTVVRSRNNLGGSIKGLAQLDQEAGPFPYTFRYNEATILSDEKGRSIRLDGLNLNANVLLKTGAQATYHEVSLLTGVDIREGQKVVVGKAGIGGTNSALILVISPKILD